MEEFTSVEQLYNRLKPAMKCKVKELKRNGYNNISENDVWNYLKNNKWKSSTNLTLIDMVNDILYTDIRHFIKENITNRKIIVRNNIL